MRNIAKSLWLGATVLFGASYGCALTDDIASSAQAPSVVSDTDAGMADDVEATPLDAGKNAFDDSSSPQPPLLPKMATGTISGNVVATAANSPYTFIDVTITGNLLVEAGVTIFLKGKNDSSGDNQINGSLTVEAGASLLCPGGSIVYTPLVVRGQTTINGTATKPVRFGREPELSYANNCTFRFSASTINHATFTSTPIYVGRPSVVRDSIFTISTNVGGSSFVSATTGTSVTDGIFEFNKFVDTRLVGNGLTVRGNRFETLTTVLTDDINGVELATDPIANQSCAGTRSLSAAAILTQNAFVYPKGQRATTLYVSRLFGAVDFSNNYFNWPATVRDYTDSWDGTKDGCSDALGTYGGPVTMLPKLTTLPPSGARP